MSPEVALIDWSDTHKMWLVERYGEVGTASYTAEDALNVARVGGRAIVVNESMHPEKLVVILAAAIFAGLTILTRQGRALNGTPVADATVLHVGREVLGNLLPDGWYLECQLNRYAACWGENMSLPYRRTMVEAIRDIHKFLAASVLQAAQELTSSLAEDITKVEAVQLSMWPSSDRP